MHFQALDAKKSGLYSKLILDYLERKEELTPFISHWPSLEGFREQIKVREATTTNRAVLVEALRKQYGDLPLGDAVENNLKLLLESNTFTLTTGQQIHIFLGPMYVYWKIVSTIALAKNLKAEFPDKNFVPVFWMATEDHDFEEINHLELFNKSFVWPNQGEFPQPVGRLGTDGLSPLLDEVSALFTRDPEWPKFEALFQEAYTKFSNFTEATRYLVHKLFESFGLLILDPDDVALKQCFLPIIQDEFTQAGNKDAVEELSTKLAENYDLQIHPREINLFYAGKSGRERLVKEGETIQTLGGEILGQLQDMSTWLPEKLKDISANVVLRPLYQEMILPNLAYIGGPGETAYWMQLKGVFDRFEVPFPILETRKSVFVIGSKVKASMEKLNLTLEDIFMEEEAMRIRALESSEEGLTTLKEELNELEGLKAKVISKAASIQASNAKPLAEVFNQAEKIIKKIDKEIFTLQLVGVEKTLEKALKIKELIKSKRFTQERNQYLVQYLSQLDSFQIVEKLAINYLKTAPVLLLLEENEYL